MPDIPLPAAEGSSIVLVGAFNPRIFHPAWFVRNELLPESAELSASVEIVNNDLCAFETDWFRLEVLSDRLVLRSMATPVVELLRDLLLGTFRILRHTPVAKIGLNTHVHYKLRTEEAWHQFGHRLAPKEELWAPVLNQPGTLSLAIQALRPDDYDGHVRVKVEPSNQVANGLFIETNDEYVNAAAESADWIDEVLTKHWESSRARAAKIRNHVLTRAYAGGEE